ncbi:MAG: thioredoxin [Lactobacillales bacterium]|jgi:thioredoxin 1|nr:thioredoxin [Lactobacillales bacterium]
MKELNAENFAATTTEGLVLVDFWAPWCGPCMAQGPILEDLDAGTDVPELSIAKVNVDDNQDLAREHGVMSIPTLIWFKDGKEVERSVGTQTKRALTDKYAELA